MGQIPFILLFHSFTKPKTFYFFVPFLGDTARCVFHITFAKDMSHILGWIFFKKFTLLLSLLWRHLVFSKPLSLMMLFGMDYYIFVLL